MYADVIIDITHEKVDKVFQYEIPEVLEPVLKVGMEVLVRVPQKLSIRENLERFTALEHVVFALRNV